MLKFATTFKRTQSYNGKSAFSLQKLQLAMSMMDDYGIDIEEEEGWRRSSKIGRGLDLGSHQKNGWEFIVRISASKRSLLSSVVFKQA